MRGFNRLEFRHASPINFPAPVKPCAQTQLWWSPTSAKLIVVLAATLSFEAVKDLILGQDPYHDNDHVRGLAFSTRPGVPIPPSRKNIYKELQADVRFHIPNNGRLIPWVQQGVLLLNSVLTVQAHQAGSHKNLGWEIFTDRIIQLLRSKTQSVVFILWGAFATKKGLERRKQEPNYHWPTSLPALCISVFFRQPTIF